MRKGQKHTEEAKKKMSNFRKGTRLSEETKSKISKNNKGKGNPFYGKHHTKETKMKISLRNKGKIIPKKTKIRMSLAHKGKHKGVKNAMFGRKHSIKTLKELSLKRKGSNNPRYGVILSQETKDKIKKARTKQVLPIKDTKIEVKIQNFLKKLGIDFFTHQHISQIEHSYRCDILIPSMNLVIECDGDYWHKYPIGTKLDHTRTSELIKKGFKVLRLWEREIKVMELNDFKNKLQAS